MKCPQMKGFSFNCKGFTDPIRAQVIKTWMKDTSLKPDFIFLQEVKTSGHSLSSNLQRLGADFTWFSTNHSAGKGGTAIGISVKFSNLVTQVTQSAKGCWVAITLDIPFGFTLVSIYAPNSANDRAVVWQEFSAQPNPCFLAGDFNMVIESSDRWQQKGKVICGNEKKFWEQLSDQLQLVDISASTGFTWNNKQHGECFRAARLDRMYMNAGFLADFWQVSCHKDNSMLISDHAPIIFDLQKESCMYRAGWPHLDQSLFTLDIVKNGVKRIFENSFSNHASAFKAWDSAIKETQCLLTSYKKKAKTIRGNRRMIIKQKIESLELLSDPSSPPSAALINLKCQLREEELLLAKDSILWTREFWAGKIDKPGKHMFTLLKKKKIKDFVPLLSKEDGTLASDHKENLSLVKDYYANIFSSPPQRGADHTRARACIANKREKTVPAHIARMLDLPLSEVELMDAIASLKRGKSPGMDGIPNEFFHEFKEFLIPHLLSLWRESLRYGALPTSVNTGVIKLIHKRGNKEDLGNWRPITCLTSVYKVFALSLARRISPLMNSIILKEQKGFIKNRFILDAIITLWEAMEYAQDSSQEYIFFKIDFDKAYDRIEWDFIFQSLHDIGFGRQFIRFVSSAKIALNGDLTNSFPLRRSIRQGCPIAPLLYAICSDALGWLIHKESAAGKIKGIQIPGAVTDLILQQFADDTNALVSNSDMYIDNFWACLNTFCLASGSVISHHKTGYRSSNGITPQVILEAGCQLIQDGQIFRLLGVPMGFKVTFAQRWDWVLTKFRNKLSHWQHYPPSVSGRSFILNHYILPSLIYFLSCWC